MKEVFEEHTDAEVHCVKFWRGTKLSEVYAYFKTEMSSKTTSALCIVHYHGKAGVKKSKDSEAEEEYKWYW